MPDWDALGGYASDDGNDYNLEYRNTDYAETSNYRKQTQKRAPMEVIQGNVTKILSKELPAPDKFENTHRLSVQIDGSTWVGLGTVKRPGLSIQQGKDWVDIKEGDKILVTATKNGDYLNAKRADVRLLSEGTAPAKQAAPAKPAYQPKQQQQSTGTSGNKRDEDIQAGMFFKGAVHIAIHQNKTVSVKEIVAAFRMLETAYQECRKGAAEEQPRPQAEESFNEPAFDDEIPF